MGGEGGVNLEMSGKRRCYMMCACSAEVVCLNGLPAPYLKMAAPVFHLTSPTLDPDNLAPSSDWGIGGGGGGP
jgi:hypothetical protein